MLDSILFRFSLDTLSPPFPDKTLRSAERNEPDIDRSQVFAVIRPNVFAGFGLMSFCFGALTASFLVYRSMTQRGVQQWVWVTKRSVSISLVIAIMLGLSGYLSFVDKTQGNILNNFPEDHKAANAARGFLAITMVRNVW